ncbi:MAG: GAF domain-containing protein [Anaerolineae bacterium]|nr:GAF domain-containing protein [Anaerolineae bacterium]
MSTQPTSPVLAHRLDKALFWLRWLVIGSGVLVVMLADTILLGRDITEHDRLPVVVGAAALGNLVLGLLAWVRRGNGGILGALGVVLDCAIALLFFWAYDGAVVLLLALGTLAVLTTAYRFRWRGIVVAFVLLGTGSAGIITQLDNPPDDEWAAWGVNLAFLLVLGLVGNVLRCSGWSANTSHLTIAEREDEARKLRATRERARAIYEMANTVSATLDHQRVLEAAQMIGALGLQDGIGPDTRLVSAVLLFQGRDNRLRVITSRGLTRADTNVALPGRRGLLGLALKQSTPVFGGDPVHDPELRYFAAFSGIKSVLAIPLRAQFDNYGVMLFGSDQLNAFSDEHVELMTAIGTQSTIALQNAVLYQSLLTEKEKIVEVEEDARKKLARDLHDGPTQSVAAIAMRVNFIRRLVERQPPQAIEELWKVEELARRTTKEIRHMLFTLRPLVLENQGLVAALEQLAEKMLDTHGQKVTIRAKKDVEEYLDTNAQGVIFYIVEEATNNARKHAEAEEILVRLYQRESFLIVEIEDNGKGFDVNAVDANYDQRGSLGMINMRERTELVEGQIRIQSAPGVGTKISILVPLQPGVGPVGDDGAGAAARLTLQGQHHGPQRVTHQASEIPPPQASKPKSGVFPLEPAPTQPEKPQPLPSQPDQTGQTSRKPPDRLRRPERPRPRSKPPLG